MKKGAIRPDLWKARIGICPICGEEFRAVNDFKDTKQKYCSKQCWNIRARVINKCKYCGKEIVTTKSVDKVYCGNECRNLDYVSRLRGENSPAWKGGKTSKSRRLKATKQYQEWRMKIFVRGSFKCQVCGGTGRDLEAHHIKEQSKYPELIFEIDNGVTLCHECHKLTDNYGYKARWINE